MLDKRYSAATHMKRVQRGRSAASTFQPQRSPRGKHGKAKRFTQKRTYAANQMKRVQRANGSLAQSGARSPSVLPAENMTRPRGLRKNVLTPPPPFLVAPRPFVLRRDRRKETHYPKVNQAKPDNRTTFENVLMAIPTHAE